MAPTTRPDETVPGGRYIDATQKKYINCDGEVIGTVGPAGEFVALPDMTIDPAKKAK
jgi:hypothetical protein